MNNKPKLLTLLQNLKPKKQTKEAAKGKRRVEQHKYKSFRLQKRLKSTKAYIPPSWKILSASFSLLKQNWKLLLGMAIIYQLLVTVLVRNFGITIGLADIKDQLNDVASESNQFVTGTLLFSTLLGSSTQAATETGGVYQMFLFVIFSLAFIWLLRQIVAGHKTGIRDALYKGMHPLIQFVLILILISIEFIPMAAATFVYSVVLANGIAVNTYEHVIWFAITALLSLLSLYLITSSIFALYIVTLPDTRPMQALRAARGLVRHRRMTILRKIIFLPISLVIIGAGIMIPFIVFAPTLAEWVFYVLLMFGFVISHIYFYTLYRKLIV